MPNKRIVIVPKNIGSGTIKTLIRKLVTGQYDRASKTHRQYTGHMVYDGYSVFMDMYFKEKHIASWDSLRGEVVYFTYNLLIIGRLIHAITINGYDVKSVSIEEGRDFPTFSNWSDFIATPSERKRELNAF